MADISKIQVGSTTYDVTDKAEHSGLTTSAKTYVGGINELDSDKIDKASQATKTSDMTAAVGIDSDGKLWSLPGGGSSTDKITNDSDVQGATATDALNKLKSDLDTQSATIVDKATYAEYTTTLSANGWSTDSYGAYRNITVSGVSSTDKVIVDVNIGSITGVVERKKAAEEWGKVFQFTVNSSNILVRAIETPSVDLPIKILCIRK